MWRDNKEKIRRFLRDPDGNIWTDGFLKRAFNDCQVDFCDVAGLLSKVEAIRVPPQYNFSYMFEFEWPFMNHEGREYKALKYNHAGQHVCCNNWEIQQLGFGTGTGTDLGYALTHPFEAWTVTNVNEQVPVWFPYDFKTAHFVAWNKETLDFTTQKEIQSTDASYANRSGKPQSYYRKDSLSNEFYIYPRPSPVGWDDETGTGQVLFGDDQDADAEIGTILDMLGIVDDQDTGIVIDVVDEDDNILLVYDGQPVDIESEDDESDYPTFMQKYVEYAVLEQAYSANTDGRIGSLRDYWRWRKELGFEFIKKFKWKRHADRDLRLISHDGGSTRNRRAPRLPDAYPEVRI